VSSLKWGRRVFTPPLLGVCNNITGKGASRPPPQLRYCTLCRPGEGGEEQTTGDQGKLSVGKKPKEGLGDF